MIINDLSYLTLHSVSNKLDDSFIGIKIKNGKIDFYYPETYNFFDKSELDNQENFSKFRLDVIDILNTISIAKTLSSSQIKMESSLTDNDAISLLSYLWIIKDYFNNGFYIENEKTYKLNQRGKVNWKRTINNQPIISKGNIIYKDIVSETNKNYENILCDIHKLCVKKSIDFIGWLFGIYDSSFIENKYFDKSIKNMYIYILNLEINKTFDDIKRLRLNHMLKIISGLGTDSMEDEIIYGVDSYYYIFERMIDSIFGTRSPSDFNPKASWYLTVNNFEPKETRTLRPDTILQYENKIYILDSKYYRYGYTGLIEDLPETNSVQKQITYGEFIKNNKSSQGFNDVKNAFILPYNKYKNKFQLNKTLEYIGFSKTNYKVNDNPYEIIYTFLIDLKYVISTWNSKNHDKDIEKIITEIENAKLEYDKLNKIDLK